MIQWRLIEEWNIRWNLAPAVRPHWLSKYTRCFFEQTNRLSSLFSPRFIWPTGLGLGPVCVRFLANSGNDAPMRNGYDFEWNKRDSWSEAAKWKIGHLRVEWSTLKNTSSSKQAREKNKDDLISFGWMVDTVAHRRE